MTLKNIAVYSIVIVTFSVIAGNAANYMASCTIDRSTIVPLVPYREITLKLPIGDGTSASVTVDGQPATSRINQSNHHLIITTTGSSVQAIVYGASSQSQIGSFKKATLKDDKLWAWSHGFDDNVTWIRYGAQIFIDYNWPATAFQIGNIIDDNGPQDSGLTWKANGPAMRELYRHGWAMGNHSWTHSGTGSWDELVKCQDKLRAVIGKIDTSYRPLSFASPMLSHDYDKLVDSIRANRPDIGLMLVEAQAAACLRVDSVLTGTTDKFSSAYVHNAPIGRFVNMFTYGQANDLYTKPLIDSLVKRSDSTHHYWFNSLEHGVDGNMTDNNPANDSNSVIGLVPYLYRTCGPNGNNTVWVETSEKIYSYLTVYRTIKLSATSVSTTTNVNGYAIAEKSRVSATPSVRSFITGRNTVQANHAYDIRGKQIPATTKLGAGIYIINSINQSTRNHP